MIGNESAGMKIIPAGFVLCLGLVAKDKLGWTISTNRRVIIGQDGKNFETNRL
jgi:hypothetical protein